jgi:hypothetical protein
MIAKCSLSRIQQQGGAESNCEQQYGALGMARDKRMILIDVGAWLGCLECHLHTSSLFNTLNNLQGYWGLPST